MKVLVTGDSHCLAYAEASATPPPNLDVEVWMVGPSNAFHRPFHDEFDSRLAFRHEVFYLEEWARRLPHFPLAHRGVPFDWYAFSGPLHLTDLWHGQDGLFHDRRLAISRTLLRQVVLDRSRAWLAFLAAARRLDLAVLVLEAPGMFAESPLVGGILRYADRSELVEIDRIARSIVRRELDTLGVPVVDLPADVFTADGFMRSAFRTADPADPHHANTAFAQMMLARTADLIAGIGSRGRPPTLPESLRADTDPEPSEVPPSHFVDDSSRSQRWVVRPEHTESGSDDIALPGLGSSLSGEKIRVSVLARSAEASRDTRFALALSVPGRVTTGPRWFWAGREALGQFFDYSMPEVGGDETLFLELRPNDGSAERTAAAEVLAVAIELRSS